MVFSHGVKIDIVNLAQLFDACIDRVYTTEQFGPECVVRTRLGRPEPCQELHVVSISIEILLPILPETRQAVDLVYVVGNAVLVVVV
jgi:hypothetical protein